MILKLDEEVDETLTFEFTGWTTHHFAVRTFSFRRQNIEGSWEDHFFTVSGEFEDLVDAIIADVMDELEHH